MIVDELLLKINKEMFENINYDEILDLRDENPFDAEWVRVDNAIEEKKNYQGYSDKEKQKADQYREAAFKKVYEFSENGELASYISDDFGFIFDSELTGYSDKWLEEMINSYRSLKIPCGIL